MILIKVCEVGTLDTSADKDPQPMDGTDGHHSSQLI